jgi:glutamate synthase domain-containing protein 3
VKFVKVMPIEYRAVLEKMEKESASCNENTAA